VGTETRCCRWGRCGQDKTDVNRTEKDKVGEDGADELSSSTSNTENIQQQQ
jgi:hypothetical protein